MTPGPRLVAALGAAMVDHDPDGCEDGSYSSCVAAILPAFLADPRTAEWLAERLHESAARNHNIGEGMARAICQGRGHDRRAAAILGRQP
jgi:hypothetical protein